MSGLSLELLHTLREKNRSTPLPRAVQKALAWDDDTYRRGVADFVGLPALGLRDLENYVPRFDLVPFAEASAHQCILLEDSQGVLVMVLSDPFSLAQRNWAQQRLPVYTDTAFAHYGDLENFLRRCEASHDVMDDLAMDAELAQDLGDMTEISLASISQDASPVVKLVNSTLYDALKSKASDIHFESTSIGLAVKYRIDGVLLAITGVHGVEVAEQTLSRLKVLAELDIAEKRVPQDGRFGVMIHGRDVDFRVSIMPSIHGEDAVLRILDKQGSDDAWKQLSLDTLGLDENAKTAVRQLAREPYGMLLVTGPTGSGKSTTLYATLSEINDGEEKIITIEDPVEYQLPGILQIPVNDKKGLTFARGLRSILRHDPDKILVGEIRDGETAQIAVQAALTGHLVLSSVHANSVFSVIDRFMHMGVEPTSFVDALNGVIAQRLIRQVCSHCAQDYRPTDELLQLSGLTREAVVDYIFRAGVGCSMCRNTGYLGRKAIVEVLRLNDHLKRAIARRAPAAEVKRMAEDHNFIPLRRIALAAVARGQTTLQEINRVTFVD